MADKENINNIIENMRACEQEIAKAIIGQEDVVHEIMLAILADGNVLLEGVPGLGKTQLVKTISKVLDLSFQGYSLLLTLCLQTLLELTLL